MSAIDLHDFRVAKIWALRSPVGWPWRSWPVDGQSKVGRVSPIAALFSRGENKTSPPASHEDACPLALHGTRRRRQDKD